MNNINIHNDSRDRGLEVLLYKKEKDLDKSQKELKKFKLKFVIPLPFSLEFNFQFETYIVQKHKPSGG